MIFLVRIIGLSSLPSEMYIFIYLLIYALNHEFKDDEMYARFRELGNDFCLCLLFTHNRFLHPIDKMDYHRNYSLGLIK